MYQTKYLIDVLPIIFYIYYFILGLFFLPLLVRRTKLDRMDGWIFSYCNSPNDFVNRVFDCIVK